MATQCPDLSTPNTLWNFCPSLGAAYAFTVLFGLTTILHLFQAIFYKKPYCLVITLSGATQTIAYIFRVLSILNPASFGEYAAWFVLILVAPLLTNAFVYMIMGRMIWNYTNEAKIYRITAWRFGALFVVLDVFALIIQIYGAATATGNNETQKQVLQGLHIYMGGVGIQQGFILLFLFFAIKFHRTFLAESIATTEAKSNRGFLLLYTIYGVLTLITTRIIFRLCEYSQGLKSNIPNHEAFQYCLDSLPMLLALLALNIVHPGRIMSGRACDIPSRKERKSGVRSKLREEGSGASPQSA